MWKSLSGSFPTWKFVITRQVFLRRKIQFLIAIYCISVKNELMTAVKRFYNKQSMLKFCLTDRLNSFLYVVYVSQQFREQFGTEKVCLNKVRVANIK